ncbi:SAM-dependent methyltransferase [Myxococcus xanthus]|uniref:class I SAM-dependent rRNA methyltransferase n=1 Tax=Myxococcus xanthus TaxID=34 RepID=UPI0011275B60|nr:class I SAM-dependent rRNA methyltransferase [Myxococcus xanthus]QDE89044.1 SAM-dependent methyltransferase [Myxococcus xanthus]
MPPHAALPVARVTPKGARSLRHFNPWVYRTEIAAPPDVKGAGAVVLVVDSQGNPIGQALYARRSPLALRLLTRKGPAEEPVDDAFFRRRLEAALARRAYLSGRDGLRLVHGEADQLPGLFVDRYGKGLTLQTLSEGMDARKETLAKMLVELTGATHVMCRDDASGRDFEGLPREARLLYGEGAARFTYHEGENRFEVDLQGDMKTGAFLDQVDNHLRAGELARGDALDLFSYHGGFALSLSRTCTSVLAVEQDEKAAARAKANAEANGRANVTVENANAFDVLRRFDTSGRRFDTVVLDPPGLAKRREGLATALRAYHELNLRAFRCLKPDGLLVTCSCSGKLDRAAFEEMVLAAAADAKRPVQILERRGAGLDHPVLAGLPETEYLKALYVRAL